MTLNPHSFEQENNDISEDMLNIPALINGIEVNASREDGNSSIYDTQMVSK